MRRKNHLGIGESMIPHRDVLVVDDDAATCVLLETLLSRAGLTVVTASDGLEALRALDEHSFDALVLDLFMPRLDGVDLLGELARTRSHMIPRVIVFSAGSEAAVAAARQQYPVWCAMRKPADISDLLENVLECLLQDAPGIRRPPHAAPPPAPPLQKRAAG
jgi:two-component system, sensor histidine kinase and response regulator